MPLAAASLNYLLDQWGSNKALYVSLHSAYSASGGNELSGGSPAYARLAATWSAASGGSKALAGTYSFNVPASSTVAWIGFWDALAGGNFAGMAAAGSAQEYAFSAPASTSALLAPGSALASNQAVAVLPVTGAALPTGLTAGGIYYVKSPSGDSFQLSASSGPGAAVTLTADGAGFVQAVTPEVFAAAGTYTLGSLSWSLG